VKDQINKRNQRNVTLVVTKIACCSSALIKKLEIEIQFLSLINVYPPNIKEQRIRMHFQFFFFFFSRGVLATHTSKYKVIQINNNNILRTGRKERIKTLITDRQEEFSSRGV
jgi:hypothetical protein